MAPVTPTQRELASRWTNMLLLAIGVAALAVLLIWLLLPLAASLAGAPFSPASGPPGLPPTVFTCQPNDTLPPALPRSIVFIGAGMAAFIIGNLLSQYRTATSALTTRGMMPFRIAVVGFFFLIALLLGYEAVGTWLTGLDPKSSYLPITSYVRCGINRYPLYATVPTIMVPYLVGHWLHRSG